MRAWSVEGGFGIDHLALRQVSEQSPPSNHVAIRVMASSINYRDWMMIQGVYNPKQPLPLIPFSDGVGEVLAVGAGTTRVKVGDRVAGSFMPDWISGEPTQASSRSTLGGPLEGMLTEYKILPENGVVSLPSYLSDEEAATLPVAAVTAWHALLYGRALKPGDNVLLQGTGGVSLFALQFAQLLGVRVILLSRSQAKIERAKALGELDGVVADASGDWVSRVKALTGGTGVQRVIDVNGTAASAQEIHAVAVGGSISLIGRRSSADGNISTIPVFMRKLTLQGVYVGSREMFEDMNRALDLHRIKPVIDRVFSFDEVPEALRYFEKGDHFGKVCIHHGK